MSTQNTLYYGDNLDILRRYIADETVDLIYLDPPFQSNQDYNVLFAEQNGSRSNDGPAAIGTSPGVKKHWKHLPPLRPHGQPLFENADGRRVWTGAVPERDHLEANS